MAEERVVKIVGDTSDADKKIKGTTENLKDLDNQADKTSKNTAKGVENVGKSAKKTNKSVGLLKGGFKALGTAIKATGIGLVISLVASLGVAFSKNQRFIDAFSTVTETLGIVLSQVATAFFNVYDSVSKNTENFDALGKVLKGVMTIVLTPFKLQFFAIKLAVQQAQLAWEKSFFGGKDNDKIKELTLGIIETKNAIGETGKDAVDAGKDIYNNFSEAITETGEIAKKTQDELSKISVKNAKLQAENIVKLQKASELAEAKLAGLTLKYQKDAELQRQIRDDVRLSIDDRIKANDELGRILEKQTKEELKLANQKLSLASAKLAVDKNNIQNQVAYQNALNEVADVEERITGQKSEQIVNEASLLDERKANLQELRNISKTEQDLAKQEALNKYENQKTLIERTVSDEVEKNKLLENAKKDYNNNIDAIDKEHKDKIEKILEVTKEKEKEDLIEKLEAEKERKLLELEELKATGEQKADIIKFYDEKINKEKVDIENKANEKRKQSAQALEDAKINIAQVGLGILGQLAKKGSAIAKGVAVSQAIISTYQGINKALAETTDPTPTQTLRFANAAAVGLAGFLNVKNILSTNESSKTSSGTNTGQGGAQAPSFNLVQGTGSNQVAETINQNQRPIQAFVVGSNVTSQQELDRRRVANSTI